MADERDLSRSIGMPPYVQLDLLNSRDEALRRGREREGAREGAGEEIRSRTVGMSGGMPFQSTGVVVQGAPAPNGPPIATPIFGTGLPYNVVPIMAPPISMRGGADEIREWRGGLCDCCSSELGGGCGICCFTCWCSCITFGKVVSKSGMGRCSRQGCLYFSLTSGIFLVFFLASSFVPNAGKPSYDDSNERISWPVFFWQVATIQFFPLKLLGILFLLAGFTYGGFWRNRIRRKFNIKGSEWSFGGDHFMHMCCSACALCQEERTLMYNRVNRGDWQGPGTFPGVPHFAMTMAPVSESMPPTALGRPGPPSITMISMPPMSH